jgi:hypothetical protein
LALTDRPNELAADAFRPVRGSESWLVGAFLLLFGVAVAAAMPAIAGAVRQAVADEANTAQGKADAARRVVVRARFVAVRTIEPKAGSDLLTAPSAPVVFDFGEARLSPTLADAGVRATRHGYHARAPPPSAA